MGLTPYQEHCVNTLDKPLAIEAGAGSGKTHTLTERIVHALECGHIQSIDQVLAITFTKKAAGELKARIKSTLRSRSGNNEHLREESLRVDDAWISTIHGMCSRILKAHAIELGIDPDFEIVEGNELDTLLDLAIDEVLTRAHVAQGSQGSLKELFTQFNARSSGGFNDVSVETMLKTLVEKAAAERRGFEAFVMPPEALPVQQIASSTFKLLEGYLPELEAQKPGDKRDAALEGMSSCAKRLAELIGQDDASYKGLLELFSDMPVPGEGFGSPEFKEVSVALAQDLKKLANEARYGFDNELLEIVFELAKQVYLEFKQRKEREGLMDNNDLLVRCAQAIDEHPAIAANYQKQFQLVMIDEFQDTDQVQLDMIRALSGEGARRLCTVGDAQQSIYRFRKADVEVYRQHLQTVRQGDEGEVVELSANFRSHEEILSFVDEVFSQQNAFADDFMSLTAGRNEDEVKVKHPEGVPRVQLQLATVGYPKQSTTRAQARMIAQKFANLEKSGYSAGDMVVLLGVTTNASIYADALRAQGLSCVISGGSVLAKSSEFAAICSLAALAADVHNTQALYEVLTSGLFALTADDLLLLGTEARQDGGARRRDLDKGFQALRDDDSLLAQASPALQNAVGTITAFLAAAAEGSLSAAMYELLKSCGVLMREQSRGSEGHAVIGNYYKSVRLVEDEEARPGAHTAQIAVKLSAMAGILKASPGALSTADSNFVRIMTVHASKGLEFPVVAVAELRSGKGDSGGLFVEQVKGKSYVALNRPASKLGGVAKAARKKDGIPEELRELTDAGLKELIERAHTPGERVVAMMEYEERAASQEAKRLAYVAFTRAKEVLIVSLGGQRSSKSPDSIKNGIALDIRSALCGPDEVFPEVDEAGAWLAHGCGEVFFTRADFDVDDLPDWFLGDVDERELDDFIIPQAEKDLAVSSAPYRVVRSGVFSYSSISGAYHDMDAALAIADEQDEDAAAWAAINANLGDADKATDLGTAFHRLAQYAVEHRAGTELAMPPAERVEALAFGCGITPEQQGRLDAALTRWFASDVAARMARFADLQAEVPLFITLDNEGAPIYLEGEIDLLALPEDRGTAVIVDYKTGGSPEESSEDLTHKHELQAMCYALALLRQGYAAVQALFVRVEQQEPAAPDQPQVVEFNFQAAQAPELERTIAATYRKSQEG